MFHAMFALQGQEEFICDATSRPRRKRTADNPVIQRLSLTLYHARGPVFVYKSCCQGKGFSPYRTRLFISFDSMYLKSWGPQRDVFYLSWPIPPWYMSPNAGGCGILATEYSCAHGAQINFGDLTTYFNRLNSPDSLTVTVKQSPCPKSLGGIHYVNFYDSTRLWTSHAKTREFVDRTCLPSTNAEVVRVRICKNLFAAAT